MASISRGLDHVVVLVRDMDSAVTNYQRMGFQMTPRMYHPFGTANNLVMFQSTFLEILGIVKPEDLEGIGILLDQLLKDKEGVSHFALASDDVSADQREFEEKGLEPSHIDGFERAVTLPDGGVTKAVVSVCSFAQTDTPRVYMFVSRQHVAEAVWVREWQAHPNGVKDVKTLTIVAQDPATPFVPRFNSLFGTAAVAATNDAVWAQTPNGLIEVLTPQAFEAKYAGADIALEGVFPYMAAMTLQVADLAQVRTLLSANGVQFHTLPGRRLVVPPTFANGVAIEFAE